MSFPVAYARTNGSPLPLPWPASDVPRPPGGCVAAHPRLDSKERAWCSPHGRRRSSALPAYPIHGDNPLAATLEASDVSDALVRTPQLDALYQRYLTNESSAHFVADVARYYTLGTLARLAESSLLTTRRAAVLAVGFLGDFRWNAVLGRALRDRDRVVRLLAEANIRELWCRDGSDFHQARLASVVRLNGCERFDKAAGESTRLIHAADWFAEAWNQRAIAYYRLERFGESLRDCREALARNPFHFAAAIGMGHCYLEMNNGLAALECLRLALQLNPDMENVRAQVDYLQRAFDEK